MAQKEIYHCFWLCFPISVFLILYFGSTPGWGGDSEEVFGGVGVSDAFWSGGEGDVWMLLFRARVSWGGVGRDSLRTWTFVLRMMASV